MNKKDRIKQKLNITEDQLYRLHFLYIAGFSTKSYMNNITIDHTVDHLDFLIKNGKSISYKVIKSLFIKDLKNE